MTLRKGQSFTFYLWEALQEEATQTPPVLLVPMVSVMFTLPFPFVSTVHGFFKLIFENLTKIVGSGKASLQKVGKTPSTLLEEYYRIFSGLPGTKSKDIWSSVVCLHFMLTNSFILQWKCDMSHFTMDLSYKQQLVRWQNS